MRLNLNINETSGLSEQRVCCQCWARCSPRGIEVRWVGSTQWRVVSWRYVRSAGQGAGSPWIWPKGLQPSVC